MAYKLLTAALLALPLAQALPTLIDTREGKIVGGVGAVTGDVPFIVSITTSSVEGINYCGGSLLNEDTIVTAGHCSGLEVARYRVRAGSLAWQSGGKQVGVKSITFHPDYFEDPRGFSTHDVAIWKLSEPIVENNTTITYAKLPELGTEPVANSSVVVAGWGSLQSQSTARPTTLMKVVVPVVGRQTCSAQYGLTMPSDMLCAGFQEGGKDSCQGDSGGPLVDDDGTLVGLVSWGKGCALPNFPGVYANVGNLVDFINENL